MNTGSVLAQFTITLSKAVTEPVAVEWFTSDGTAKAGIDYAANKGIALFAPGETQKKVEILVFGRAIGSEDRSFFVEMLPPTNAILGASIGECIIHVDTSVAQPVTRIIVPTGPKGDHGDSAYQIWLAQGNTGTEQDFFDSFKPNPADIAKDVAPLLDVGSTVLTAKGTESFAKPDKTTVKDIARRVAYAGAAKIGTVVLADGSNTLSPQDITGDTVDFSVDGFVPLVEHNGSLTEPDWFLTESGKLTINGAVAGDVLYAVQYPFTSSKYKAVRRSEIESLQAGLASFGSSASGKGDALISVMQPATGIARTQHDKNRDIISVKDFGAPTGNDWTAIFQKAINDTYSSGGGTIFIPDGRYGISTLTLKSGVSIIGTSKECCTILPLTANAAIFKDEANLSSHGMIMTIANISIDCGSVAGITGVKCVAGNRMAISDVNFYGCAINIEFDQGGNHLISNVLSAPGAGASKAGQLKLWSSDDGQYGAVFTTVTNYRVEGDSVSPAIFMRRAVGLKFSNLVINDNSYEGIGIVIENDCQGILINGGIIVGAGIGAVFRKGGGIDKAPIVNIFQDVDFDQCQENSILFNAGVGNRISGGVITSSKVGANTKAVAFVGQDAQRNRLDGVSIGGYYEPGGVGVLISNAPNNKFNNVTIEGTETGFAFNGDARGTVITGGDVVYNVTNKTSGLYQQEGVSITNLKGFKGSAGVITPPIPTTGVAVTNNFGVPVRIFIKGGTVTKIQINGNDLAFTSNASISINPGETIAVFYSSGTDWSWIGT